MAHHQRAPQHNQPADEEEGHKDPLPSRVLDTPHHSRHRPPLPIEQVQTQAREKDIRAPLNRRGNDLRPRPLVPWASHHSMLHRKEAQQKSIDHQCSKRELPFARIDGLRNKIVPDKSHRIKKRDEEKKISHDSVEKCRYLCHGRPPEVRSCMTRVSALRIRLLTAVEILYLAWCPFMLPIASREIAQSVIHMHFPLFPVVTLHHSSSPRASRNAKP